MLIATDKNQKVGYYTKTFTGMGVLNAYYYFFRLKSGSRLKLKAPENSEWNITENSNIGIQNNNFEYSISNDKKILYINVKNIPKNSLHLYDFLLNVNGKDTFISFVINWNYYYSYDKIYYNNNEVLTNKPFYCAYADSVWYSIQYQNVFPTFSTNESNTKMILNRLNLITNIENNWKNNTNIYQKPRQSKVSEILNGLASYTEIVTSSPLINITWTINQPVGLFVEWSVE
jgi:hypothetical protein